MAPPSPASASFPGANGKIFYTSDAAGHLDIWNMDPSGANQTNLNESATWDERSAASPDGMTVAYASHVFPSDVGIYLMNADGSGKHVLVDDPEVIEWDPAFTPDGGSVLFTGQSGVTKPEVYTVPITGGTPIDLTNNSEEDREPDACATNGRIAFVSSRTVDNDIYVMDANGANQTDLTNLPETQQIQPSWSPDCSHIVYVSNQNGNKYDVYVMEANGGNQTRITTTVAEEQNPTWSPDGTQIAYASGQNVVIQAPVPGAATTPIPVGPVGAELAQPTWAPIPGSSPGGGGGNGEPGGAGSAGASGSGAGPGAGAGSRKPPQTKIGAVHVHGRTAIVTFSGALPKSGRASTSTAGLTFKCKLDKGRFRPCTSPKKYKRVKPGRHRVEVEAIGQAGADPTPAQRKFSIHG